MGGRPGESGLRRVGPIAALLLQPTRLLDGPAQDELDLPVETAQIIVRPALKRLQQGRVDTKQERLAISHEVY